MPSPALPSSLVPCATTASLLVISHPEIHLRKRSAVLNRILDKESGASVIVVQTENPKFGPSIERTAETINLWDDCRGWQDDGGGGAVPGRVALVQSRIAAAAAKINAPKSATVLFHSLSSLLLHEENSPVDVARMVNGAMGNARVGRVVAVTEEDEERLKSLRNLFQTELLLNPADDGGLVRAVCRHRPTAGKPSVKSELFEVSKDGALRVIAAKVKVKAAASSSAGTDSAESDSAAMSKLTTFSLELSEAEKRARSQVVLPFWKEEQKAAAAGAAGGGSELEEEDVVRITPKRGAAAAAAAGTQQGKIYYEPDDGDDWDEEDPDDDLDF